MWDIHLVIFARNDVMDHITDITTDLVKTGIAGIMGNKGAVACGFKYRQNSTIAFLSSHLAARATRVENRNEDFKNIVNSLSLGQVQSIDVGGFGTYYTRLYLFDFIGNAGL